MPKIRIRLVFCVIFKMPPDIAELTDTNRVLSRFTFFASETGFRFNVSGNTLTITTDTAPAGNVTISVSRSTSRCGVLAWADYKYGPNGGVRDKAAYTSEYDFRVCMQKRNRHLVDNSSRCICFLTEKTGGTFYTINYASNHGLTIINIAK